MKVSNKKKGCPVVSLSAGSMMAGDTVTVTIAKKLEDGTIVPYPAGTEFILNLVKGESYGTLVGSGGKGTTITSTLPIHFIANDEIDVSSAVVTIRAEVSAGGVSASKKSVVKPMAETCEPAEASAKVIYARPCSRSYMGWNLQNYDGSNDPASCNSVNSDGWVPGGFSHPVWPSSDHDVNTTVSFCVDNSSNPPVYRECIVTISMWMAVGVCEKNLYPSRIINDLSSSPIDEIPDVIADFTNQIKILRGGDISVHLSGKYMYLPAIIEHEKAHITTDDNIIIEQALALNNEIESQPISAQLAEELGSDESVRKQYAAAAMYRLQLKAQPLITKNYGVSDEQNARSVQADALQDAINRLESRLKNK